ncbi:MAG TPA: cytidine deaminase [Terriglobia bacterium]|nr:cytidine deaminase [Terriglobia bacterium]
MNPDLIASAVAARQNAVAPYSRFKVGAALETKDGRIFNGCNIENASFGLTVCAERVALWKALSDGAREFVQIAVVTDAPVLTSLCGACRQLLWEYCGDIKVHIHSTQGLDKEYQLSALLPHPFDANNLKAEL